MEASSGETNVGAVRPKASGKPRKRKLASERSPAGVKGSERKRKPHGSPKRNVRKKSKARGRLGTLKSEKTADNTIDVCKPLSVSLTRLPEIAVNEKSLSSTKKSKKKKVRKRIARWKNGITKRKKSKVPSARVVSGVVDDHVCGEATMPDPESASRQELNNGEGSSLDREASLHKQIDEIERVPEEIESGSTIDGGTDARLDDRSCVRVLEIEAIVHSPIETRDANVSQERETLLDETPDALESTTIVAKACSLNVDSQAEEDSERNSDEFLQQTETATNKEDTHRRISRQAVKRKRITEGDESNEQHRSSRRTKKLKSSTLVHAESISAPQPLDTSSNDNSAATLEREHSLTTLKSASPKFIRDRRKSNEIHLAKEALVFITRLENLRSPLIKKWANRVALMQSSLVSLDEYSSNENRVDNGKTLDSRTVDNSLERIDACPMPVTIQQSSHSGEVSTANGIVMCDSNEEDSDGDDDEIIAFLTARCRSRKLIKSSDSENDSNDQAYRKVQLSRNSSSAMSLIGSVYDSRLDVQQTAGRSSLSRRSVTSVDDAPGFVSSCTEFKRPDSSHNDVNWEDESSHDESVIAPPLTRSRSRAALESFSYESTPNVSELSKERCKPDVLFRVSSYNCENSSDTMTIKETNETERRVTDSCTENSRDVVEREPSEENDASLAAATVVSTFSPIDTINLPRDDSNEDRAARKTLAAMRNAMVVLTRLEDLNALGECGNYNTNEIVPKRPICEVEFSSDFCREDLKDDVDSNYDTNDGEDSHYDGMRRSCRRTDPLEIDRAFVDQSHITGNEDIVEDPEDGSSPQRATGSDLSRRHVYNGISREQNESENEGELTVDEGGSQETAESDVELTLVFDEGEHLSNESSARAEAALTISNVMNDRSLRSPGVKSPEHRDNRSEKRQNISPAHKCDTCSSVFNDPVLLEQHRSSNASCNAFTTDQTSLTTHTELTSHRVTCGEKGLPKRHSGEQSTNEETTLEPRNPLITESVSTKDKKQKQTGHKNFTRKGRSRPRCRVDNLTCNVCSMNFETKTALSEHLYKHSSVELQEAFRIAKAKAMATAQAENAARKNKAKAKKKAAGDLRDDDAIVEASGDDSSAQNFDSSEMSFFRADALPPVIIDSSTSTLATVCLCHRDNDQMSLDNTDLQIEMVLLCKYCHVLFRRRECLEVHYRTSVHCATDRTRERWPRLFCANCQLTLNNWADMRQHLEIHARQNAECAIRFVCNICRVVFVGFGTLFYNHWISHSKDSMFVAGRYNFPKFSVQTVDGTEKLPAGARADENYIFVAEHVCTVCKKPFSMRRDLEAHQQTQCCGRLQQQRKSSDKQVNNIVVAPLWCDMCYTLFANEKAMNDHAASKHNNRYVYVTAGTPAKDKPFKCTACVTFASSIRAIDDHWKSSMHELPAAKIATDSTNDTRSTIESIKVAESVPVTSSFDDRADLRRNESSSENANCVTSTDKNLTAKPPPLITIEEDDDTVTNDCSQAGVRTSESLDVPANNRKTVISVSPSTSTESNMVSRIEQLPILRGVFLKPPSAMERNAAEKQTLKTRALEDPCVNVVVSDTCGTNLFASLVLNDVQEKTKNKTVDGNTDSYRILLTDDSSMGSATHVLNSESTEDTPVVAVSLATPLSTLNDRTETDKTTTTNSSDPIVSLTVEPSTSKTPQKSMLKVTTGCSSGQAINRRSPVPEVIDIDVDDDTAAKPGKPTSAPKTIAFPVHKQPVDTTLNKKKNNRSLREFRKLLVGQSQAEENSTTINTAAPRSVGGKGISLENVSSSETSSFAGRNVTGTSSRSRPNAAASKASKISYEEERWNWLRSTSANPNVGDSMGTKKQGFLRVKDLSELQAVRTHTCCTCNMTFQSETELGEHHRLHVCGDPLTRSNVRYPTGMSAALVLPEAPEHQKTPAQRVPAAYTSENASRTMLGMMNAPTQSWPYVPQRLLSSLARQQNPTTSRLPDTAVTEDPLGPWVLMGSKNAPVATTQPGFGRRMAPNIETSVRNLPNANAINTMIGTSATSTSQIPNSITGQQQQQLLVSSINTVDVPDTSQRLSENRTAGLGYHVLPPMVVLPSGQSGKTASAVASQRATSNNYLPGFCGNNSPITYQSAKRNKFLCNICHTFECDNIDTFNCHVTKHYTGWKNTHGVAGNSIQPSPVAMISATTVTIPTLAAIEMRTETNQQMTTKTTEINPTANSVSMNNWTVKDTPQGPILVTPVSGSNDPLTLSSFAENNNRSVLRQTPLNTNNPNANNYSGQIVLRCMICKSALYKNYPPLRNHVILVHGVTDFSLLGLDNIAQKSYHCTQCPSTTALFDCEEKYREHVDTIHTHACPSCRRVFSNFLTLRHHLEQCRVSSSNDRSTYGNNC